MPRFLIPFVPIIACLVTACAYDPPSRVVTVTDITGCQVPLETSVTAGAPPGTIFRHMWITDRGWGPNCPEDPVDASGTLVTLQQDGPRSALVLREFSIGNEFLRYESTDMSLAQFRMSGSILTEAGDRRVHVFRRTELAPTHQEVINTSIERLGVPGAAIMAVVVPPRGQYAPAEQVRMAAARTNSERLAAETEAEYNAMLRRKARQAQEARTRPAPPSVAAVPNPLPLLPPSFTEDWRRSQSAGSSGSRAAGSGYSSVLPPSFYEGREDRGAASRSAGSSTAAGPTGGAGYGGATGPSGPRPTPVATPGGGTCHATSAALGKRLPNFSAPLLQKARQTALSEDINRAMQAANGMGYTPERAIDATFEQARIFDQGVNEALRTASEVDSLGNSDEEFLQQLNSGRLNVSTCEGVRNGALCQAVILKLGALSTRWIGGQLECHLRNGTWPTGSAAPAQVSVDVGPMPSSVPMEPGRRSPPPCLECEAATYHDGNRVQSSGPYTSKGGTSPPARPADRAVPGQR